MGFLRKFSHVFGVFSTSELLECIFWFPERGLVILQIRTVLKKGAILHGGAQQAGGVIRTQIKSQLQTKH